MNKQFKNLFQSIRICAVLAEGLKFNLNLFFKDKQVSWLN
jgi:hypothetical protein